MPTKKTNAELIDCTCGHRHARGERCGAIVSGVPMLTYCECPGALAQGEHLRPLETPQ